MTEIEKALTHTGTEKLTEALAAAQAETLREAAASARFRSLYRGQIGSAVIGVETLDEGFLACSRQRSRIKAKGAVKFRAHMEAVTLNMEIPNRVASSRKRQRAAARIFKAHTRQAHAEKLRQKHKTHHQLHQHEKASENGRPGR